MTEWMPIVGGTLFIASGPTGDHLFVIASNPIQIQGYGSSEQVLLVPFCSVCPKHDPSCIVKIGEHEFVKHESFVDYRSSRVESVSHIRARIAEGIFKEHRPVSEHLLRRIQQGLANSTRVPRHIKDDFKL